MGRCIILGNSSGIDTDECTATSNKVLSPYTFYGFGSDEIQTGTIPNMNGVTIIPGKAQQIVSCADKYMNGNIVVNGVTNLLPQYIRKGVSVGGVVGTWEGYVATPTDLYNRGANNVGFSSFLNSGIDFQNNQLVVPMSNTSPGITGLVSSKVFNFAGYSNLLVEGSFLGHYSTNQFIGLSNNVSLSPVTGPESGKYSFNANTYTNATLVISLQPFQISSLIKLYFHHIDGYVYRIRVA